MNQQQAILQAKKKKKRNPHDELDPHKSLFGLDPNSSVLSNSYTIMR